MGEHTKCCSRCGAELHNGIDLCPFCDYREFKARHDKKKSKEYRDKRRAKRYNEG